MTKLLSQLSLLFCLVFLLSACSKENKELEESLPILTTTVTQTPIQSTNTPVPPFIFPATANASTSLRPTISAPLSQNPIVELPGNLNIEIYEISIRDFFNYEAQVWEKHYDEVGGKYSWQYLRGGKQFINGKQLLATEKDAEIYITLGSEGILEAECLVSPMPRILTSWVYESHWAIQTFCEDNFDVFQDGVSLNTSKNYSSSFGFQLIGNKPFYLFKKNNSIGLYYEGKEVPLEFDKIVLAYCCTVTISPPIHYENMITFAATKGEKLYYVAIGLFESK